MARAISSDVAVTPETTKKPQSVDSLRLLDLLGHLAIPWEQ
jgi:hypothetical protein